ncbi:MAG: hypothetical protein RSC76_04655 [Oscillospiraceae bacterium]
MEFFKNISGIMLATKDVILEKNRKSALTNRLRAVVKCEEQCADRAYLALGRYYYHNLRDVGNPVTEPHCVDVDASEKRLEQAISHLEEIYNENGNNSVIEKVNLDDAKEIQFEEDTAIDGIVDEAVAATTTEQATEPVNPTAEAAADGENEDLPFEG